MTTRQNNHSYPFGRPISERYISPLHAIVLAWLAACSLCHAVPQFSTQHWLSEDGLPTNALRAVAQAADGYLWIGTADGVVRFDGVRFSPLSLEPPGKQGHLSIRALYPLANGDVWVTTRSNALFRGHGMRLEEVAFPPATNGDPDRRTISQVVLGETGAVFAVYGKELWRVDGKTPERVNPRPVIVDSLLKRDLKAEPERGRIAKPNSEFRLRGAKGHLWLFSASGSLCLAPAGGQAEPVSLPAAFPSSIQGMTEDREGNLWLATSSQGLWQVRPARVEIMSKNEGLTDGVARLVMEDRKGALWVPPQAGGVDRMREGAVRHYDIGTPRGRTPLSSLLETRDGGLWAATRDSQVFFLSGTSEAFLPFPSAKGPSRIVSMAEDDSGRIWFGGANGLTVWDGLSCQPGFAFESPENVTVVVSSGSNLWVGTESGRVLQVAGQRREVAAAAETFERQPISALLPDADGRLWIGTMGGGLFALKDGHVTSYGAKMRDADRRIISLVDDGAGFLWMGTLGGICRAEKAMLLGTKSKTKGTLLVLDRSDGMLTSECCHYGHPSGWRGQNGTLYFCTANGLALVNPERFALNTVPPPVVIEAAVANGVTRPVADGRLKVGPGRSRLEFRYTALSFTAPEKVRFRLLLEGLDTAWREMGAARNVAYDSIPPGKYRLHVMARNGDGIWNETGATLAVEVLPHFWEALWFRVLAAFAAAALAVGCGALVTRTRMRHQLLLLEARNAREAERARIARDLHDDLGASLTEISLLSGLAVEERQQAGGDPRTLNEIATSAQSLVGVLDEIVWAANPRNDSLYSLAEYLPAFAERFLSRANMALRREIPRELSNTPLDTERRHNVFLAVREALNNAVKHSGANEVCLRLREDKGNLTVEIADNGIGFDPGSIHNGNGMENLVARIKHVGGTCRIDSRPGSGTTVLLTVPL